MTLIKVFLSPDAHAHIKIWRERCTMDDRKFKANFGNLTERFLDDGTPYDLNSIMHYSPMACAINSSLPVITKPDGSPVTINKTDTFSYWDIEQINHIYNCSVENLKPEGEYCIKLESNCSEAMGESSISLFHNNVKIDTIPAGFKDYEHCLPLHWVDIENDKFKFHIDGSASQNVSFSKSTRKSRMTLKTLRLIQYEPYGIGHSS